MEQPINPDVQNPPPVVNPIPAVPKKKPNVLLIVVLLIVILLFVAGVAYAGMQISRKQTPVVLPTAPPPEVRPTEASSTSISDETGSWKTYTDSNLNYSFQYPPTSCELQRSAGDTTFALCYLPKGSDGGPKHNNGYVISHGFISESQQRLMGATYCDGSFNDSSRCEFFEIGEVTASIDWGTGGDGSANVRISHPNGGIITFTLQPVTAESKEILKQILSAFKFTS